MPLDYSIVGEGEPLLLLLGFGMSREDALELGYVAALQNRWRLICVSPRGHGASPAPHGADRYRLPAIVADIAALLDTLGVQKTAVWGYSLGAKFALGLAAWHPRRVSGLLLGGFEQNSDFVAADDIVMQTLRQGGAAWRALWQQLMAVPPGMAARLEASDMAALQALRLAEKDWPDMAGLLARLEVEPTLYAAEGCFARQDMEKMAAARKLSCVLLPGCDHFTLLAQSEKAVSALLPA